MTLLTILNIFLVIFSPYLAIIPLLFLTFKLLMTNNCIFVKSAWNLGLLFLFIWSFLVGIINECEFSSIVSIAILIYFFASVYIQNHYYKENKIEDLLNVIMIFAVFSAIIGLIERFTSIHYTPSWWKHLFGIYPFISFNEKYRISGTFANPNIAGLWYGVMVLITFYFFQRTTGFKKLLYVFGMTLFLSVLLMTESRGAIIGLLIGLTTYAYFMGHSRKVSLLIIFSMIFLTVSILFPNLFPRGYNLASSINDRKLIWINCWNMFKHKPITGWGLMGIYFADTEVFNYIRTFHAHNIILNMLTTLGLIGLIVFSWMQYHLFIGLQILDKKGCRITPLLAGVQAIILGQGLLDFAIMSPQAGILFITCSALINSLAFQYSYSSLKEYSIILKLKNKLIDIIDINIESRK